jgi:prepilin-type N-terminal cleavage/methylation domain-containing protein
MTRQKQQGNRGFTIIEMLIAVFIFTVAISALTYMAGRGIRAAGDSQNRITAEFLAIEGMEVVRNVRDSAFLRNLDETTWENVFGGDISGPGGCFNALGDSNQEKTCGFVYDDNDIPQLESCNQCGLYLGETTRGYSHSPSGGGDLTSFTRKIYINEINPGEVKVRTVVEWPGDSVEYQENLFLWG